LRGPDLLFEKNAILASSDFLVDFLFSWSHVKVEMAVLRLHDDTEFASTILQLYLIPLVAVSTYLLLGLKSVLCRRGLAPTWRKTLAAY